MGTSTSLDAAQGCRIKLSMSCEIIGGDAGDNWRSFAFLHIDRNCKITSSPSFIQASIVMVTAMAVNMKYRFLDNSTIEVNKSHFSSEGEISRKNYKEKTRSGNNIIWRTCPEIHS